MTDQEIVDKCDNMAFAHMSRSQIEQLVEEVFNLENIDDVCKILELLTFEKRWSYLWLTIGSCYPLIGSSGKKPYI